MLEQVAVWVIVIAAAIYAIRAIVRSLRESGDHCGDCGIEERKRSGRDRG